MEKMGVIIIDDERPARQELIVLLKDIPGIIVQGEAANIKDALKLIAEKKPDIILLDIQLSGENGFDLLLKIPINFKVIFVTAHPAYALKAFEVNAAGFLLKPVDPNRLSSTLKKILDGNSFARSITH